MLMKPCPMCGKLYQYGKLYCPDCMPVYEARKAEHFKQASKRYDDKRKDSRETRFYKSKQWQRLAAATVMSKGYKCERCGKYANQVHHKVRITTKEGWCMRFEPSNLELLCLECHNAEHGRFQKRRSTLTPGGGSKSMS